VVGFEFDRATIRHNRFSKQASLPERVPQIVVGFHISGFQFHRPAKRSRCLLEPAPHGQHDAQIVVRFRESRFEFDRAATRGDGFVQPPDHAIGRAEIGMGVGIIRVEGDRFADPLYRRIVASDLHGDDTEEVQRVHLRWLRGQDLAVNRLGLRQPPGSVMLNRNLKRLWNGHGKDEG